MNRHFQRIGIVLALALVCLPVSAHARDWFVHAGSTGGDGSRERPFADPWQALDKVEAGDKVHVTEGQYYGKLEAGYWVIPFARVELYRRVRRNLHTARSVEAAERTALEKGIAKSDGHVGRPCFRIEERPFGRRARWIRHRHAGSEQLWLRRGAEFSGPTVTAGRHLGASGCSDSQLRDRKCSAHRCSHSPGRDAREQCHRQFGGYCGRCHRRQHADGQ